MRVARRLRGTPTDIAPETFENSEDIWPSAIIAVVPVLSCYLFLFGIAGARQVGNHSEIFKIWLN
jgi:hypothetical protein